MYKHILVPTDGSDLSEAAARGAVKLAHALGARITAVHVVPPGPVTVLEAWAHGSRRSAEQLAAYFRANARRYLAAVRECARGADVRCRCVQATGADVHAEIIQTAVARRCDLIYMASHGRRGSADVILGSETVKVLTHSPVPVLVHRTGAKAPSTARGIRRRARGR